MSTHIRSVALLIILSVSLSAFSEELSQLSIESSLGTIEFDDVLSSTPPDASDLSKLDSFMRVSIDETYLDLHSVRSASLSETHSLNRTKRNNFLTDEWTKVVLVEDLAGKYRHLIFEERASKIELYQLVNLIGTLSMMDAAGAIKLLEEIYNNASSLGLVYAQSTGRERIEGRVYEEIRSGLLDGRYGLETIRSLNSEHGRDQAILISYGSLDEEIRARDSKWFSKVVSGIRTDLLRAILRAARRTQSPHLEEVVRDIAISPYSDANTKKLASAIIAGNFDQ